MKILFDVSVLGNGHSFSHSRTGVFRVAENLASGLHETDNCQTIFCASSGNYFNCRKYFESRQDLTGYNLSQPADLLSSLYNYFEPIRLEIAKLPENNWKTPFRKIYRYGKRFIYPLATDDVKTADVFHSPCYAIPEQVIRHKNIAKFITIHDLIPVVCPEYCISASVEYMKTILDSIKPDTFIICDSASARNDLLNHMPFIDPAKVSVVHLAADCRFYQCTDAQRIRLVRQKYSIPPDSRYLLGLSTLQPRKNFERVIKNFIRLLRQEQIKDLYLVLVGAEGWDYDQIYSEIESAGECKEKILLTGYVPDEDLAPLYSDALAFLYPSLYEGFGLPPLEAMQCGTPVITSNNSSLPEVVGDAAIMVDPKDDEALCQAMLDVCNNESLHERLARLSFERAKLFTWENTTRETINAYRRALA